MPSGFVVKYGFEHAIEELFGYARPFVGDAYVHVRPGGDWRRLRRTDHAVDGRDAEGPT